MRRFALFLLLAAVSKGALVWHGSSEAIWHGNVTNADRAADRLPGLQARLAGTAGRSWQVAPGTQLHGTWHAGLDWWPRFEGLDSVSAGPELGLNRRFGLGSQAWVVGVTGSGGWVGVREAERTGWSGQLRAEVKKRWGDAWQFSLGVEHQRFDARGRAFSHSGRDYFLRAEFQVSAVWHAALEYRRREGSVVSYTTPPRPDLVQAGKVLTLVDTFKRPTPLLAYYFPAETQSLALSLTRRLGPATALRLNFSYAETIHGTLRYLNPRSGVGLLHRF